MNGFNVKYAELLGLSLQQGFYQNNYCKKYTTTPEPDFLLVPSAECLDTMKRLDYLCRQTPENAGLVIFSRVLGTNGAGDNLLRFKPAAGDKLCFWMVLKNPAVINFDQLPVQQDATKLFYFTNQLTDGAALRNNLHITSNAAGVDETIDRIAKQNTGYQFHHGAVVAPGTAVVKHTITGIQVEPKTIANQAFAADLYFDLSSLPQGKCKLLINNIQQDEFYFMGTEASSRAFGVIELLLTNTLDANYRIVETDRSITNTRPLYTISFINRPTRWRYTVELKKNSPLFIEMDALAGPAKTDFINRLNIISNDTAITFTQTSASPDGTSFQFESTGPVALREKYISSSSVTKETLNLTLKKLVGLSGEVAVKTDLQCPSTGGINAINNPVIYSDILLTI